MDQTAMMSESGRLAKLFSDWFDGNPWSYVKMSDILKDVSAKQASKKLIPNANTIWQLVVHCLGWRDNVLRKMKGEDFKSPDDNYMSVPEDQSETAWKKLKDELVENENQWQIFLKTLSDDQLNEGYKPSKNEFTNYEVIHGLLHHDNYHFGQLVMLKKFLGEE